MPPVRGDLPPTETRPEVGALVPVTMPGAKTRPQRVTGGIHLVADDGGREAATAEELVLVGYVLVDGGAAGHVDTQDLGHFCASL